MNALFLTLGLLLCVVWAVSTVPLILAFHRAAEKAGFDVFEPKNALALFRLQMLPAAVRPMAKRIRFQSIALLWSAALLIALGLLLTATKEGSNQALQTTSVPAPRNSEGSLQPGALHARV